MNQAGETHACFAALALERRATSAWARRVLDRADAQGLAARIAADLARLLPGATQLDLALAAALFDPAELLRPGWPAHAGLLALSESSPGVRGGRVIALGAHQGRMAEQTLEPDPQLAEGLLGVMPLVLFGTAEAVQSTGAQMEHCLLDTGMADAATALALQQAYSVELEHCRFLSLHDLCAMTAMQYQHAGLDAIWNLVEAALLAPTEVEWMRRPGLVAAQRDGRVLVAQTASDPDARIAVRQLQVILQAHQVPVIAVPVAERQDPAAAVERALGQPGMP